MLFVAVPNVGDADNHPILWYCSTHCNVALSDLAHVCSGSRMFRQHPLILFRLKYAILFGLQQHYSLQLRKTLKHHLNCYNCTCQEMKYVIQWTVSTWSWGSVRIWVTVSRTKLWWLDDWVIGSPKQKILWGGPSMQWLVVVKVGQVVSWLWAGQVVSHGCPRLTDEYGEQWLACLVQCNKIDVAHIAENVIGGYDQSECTYCTDPCPPPK